MASVLLSPVGNSGIPFFDNNGVPLNAGLVYTYQAGSSTLLTTYTTVNGTVANPNPIVLNASGQMPNEVWLQTGYSYKFVIQTSANVTIQTLDNVYPILQSATTSGATIPSGLIAIWSGSTGSIPSGWLICDGTSGTPDLRSSFIIGAGSTYSVGQTGGSADAIVVSHTHTVTDPGHKHNVASTGASSTLINASAGLTTGSNSVTTDTATTGITLQTAGTSGTGANLPPYYALAFIMKT
jgi:microcystin-dependent protein